jgi:hypothetical protein
MSDDGDIRHRGSATRSRNSLRFYAEVQERLAHDGNARTDEPRHRADLCG